MEIDRRGLFRAAGGAALSALLRAGEARAEEDAPPTRTAARLERLPFRTRRIPLGFVTYRLRDIHLDADGDAWIGANEPDRHILVVNLKTGRARKVDMNLGGGQYLDMVLPVGEKIVVCGGGYAKQVFLHRKTGRRVEKPLAAANPLIYGGIVVGRFAYLFDSAHGLYRWDAREETGAFYPFTLPGRPPVGGVYAPSKEAIYGVAWWQEGMPLTTLVKFDTKTKRFEGPFVPPWPDVRPMVPVLLGGRLYHTDMFGGTMMIFDLKTERWIARYRLPDHERSWKYAATVTAFGPYIICCLSTFQGTKNAGGTYGWDGQRHHFVNRILAFDTRTNAAGLVEVPSLSGRGYATVAYLRTLQGRLYGTCVDSALLPDGKPEERGAAYLTEFTR